MRILVDHGHPWRPPFGLDRIGQPLTAVVQIDRAPATPGKYVLVGLLDGKEVKRAPLATAKEFPFVHRVEFPTWPTELVLVAESADASPPIELARQPVEVVEFEALAEARPDTVINPVDLGTILVPSGWLLLEGAQPGSVDVAAICRMRDIGEARAAAWFESRPEGKSTVSIELRRNRRAEVSLRLPPPAASIEHDVLCVVILENNGGELWRQRIETMLVHQPPRWPEFGATATKLRYDAPISIRAADGTFSSIPYAEGWAPHLDDVVVFLPGGARFVFWRGACYIPFWAGKYNTCLSYEWAETGPPPGGFADAVEPLMDKELRYGRVTILESTPARVHVRWDYQSCDFNYKVWGDSAVEDFCFYRDGFGTRTLTLKSALGADYELSEFIILTSQGTYPLSILPENLVDAVFLDGVKREFRPPFVEGPEAEYRKSRDMAAVYRVRLHGEEPLTAVYFNPNDKQLPPRFFGPFFNQGVLVTPVYWGSHWPLARGNTTGGSINDRIQFTPAHNSVMTWSRSRPVPNEATALDTVDTLGQTKRMNVEKWVWLIGMTNVDDARLLQWARSFASPPELELEGARFEAYLPERRASRLRVESDRVRITIKPAVTCLNPVFELDGAPKVLSGIWLAGRRMASDEFAWDGQTLWLRADIDAPTELRLEFQGPKPD
ncbi:MAG: hypothetical protein ABIK89_22375 [Planctomycetota bacterium]